MEFNELIKREENTILEYVVFNEHTLGYLFRWIGHLGLGILNSKIVKGGIDWKNSPYLITANNFQGIRKATKEDFDSFRVSSKYLI